MRFVKIVSMQFAEGRFDHCDIEIVPIYKRQTTVAIYSGIWHRIRRDRIFKIKAFGYNLPKDPGVLDISNSYTEDGALMATIRYNHCFSPLRPPFEVARCVEKTLRYMDRLVRDLVSDDNHGLLLLHIANLMETDHVTAENELREMLKIFCRSRGLFINEDDANYALAQGKNRRREVFFAAHPEWAAKQRRREHSRKNDTEP